MFCCAGSGGAGEVLYVSQRERSLARFAAAAVGNFFYFFGETDNVGCQGYELVSSESTDHNCQI